MIIIMQLSNQVIPPTINHSIKKALKQRSEGKMEIVYGAVIFSCVLLAAIAIQDFLSAER